MQFAHETTITASELRMASNDLSGVDSKLLQTYIGKITKLKEKD